jgi:hypothetical protein
MPMPQLGTTTCNVRIVTPKGEHFVFGPRMVGTAPRPYEGGLLSVETDKDLAQAVGGFTLVLDGRPNETGRYWDDRIPMRSLVFISMERPGVPGLPEADGTVMIGLTDTHSRHESYESAGPRRIVTIRGRELSCVILDATLVFNPKLAANETIGTISIASEAYQTIDLALSVDPFKAADGSPLFIVQTLLDHYLFVGGSTPQVRAGAPGTGPPIPQHPVITLDIPGMPLTSLLNPNYGAWSTFEHGIRVDNATQLPSQVGNLWTYLHLYIDRHFQEFFTRIEEGQCTIHFRGKPFRHAYTTSGTRFKSGAGAGSGAGPDREPTLQTLVLDPSDILSQQLGRDSTQVYNFFLVLPRGMMDLQNADNYLWKVTPSVIVDHEHPSFVGRYGIRFMKVETPYLSAFPAGAGTEKPTPLSAAQKQDLPPQPAGAAVWADKANAYAAQAGIIPEHRPWFVALIQQESSFRPDAVGKSKDGSRDEGIAQFNNVHGPNPASIGLTNPFDPDNALQAAARYWQILRGQVGNDPRLIAAAYNAGAGAVRAAKGIPPQAAQHVRNVERYVPRHQHYAGTAPQATGVKAAGPSAAPAPASSSEDVDGIVEIAQRWSALLMAWYDMGGELFSGSLTVRGHPAWNIGHRLLYDDPRGAWEAYIEGVHHRYDMRTGQYLTQLRITRGWPLTEAGAAQLWQEAQTTVTESTGGPPILDPQTGEPGAGWSRKEVTVSFPGFPDIEPVGGE